MKLRILFVLAALFALSQYSHAQELQAKVIVNLNNPPEEERRNWESFASEVESYLNSYNWTTNFSGDRIQCNFTFNITGFGSNGYTAQIYVTSIRPRYKSQEITTLCRFSDEKVSFQYVRGQSLNHGQLYRPLETILDYYANLILGQEFDSYGRLDGDEYYQAALGHALVANSSGGFGWDRLFTSSGAFSRYGYAEDATISSCRPLRQMMSNYHFTVLDLAASNEEVARANYAKFIDSLITMKRNTSTLDRSVYFKAMLEAKYAEFAEFGRWFKDNLDLYYKKLSYLDPTHQTYYEGIKEKYRN
jgi:hypothetical protein